MRGLGATGTEIVGRGDEALPEVQVPHAVRHHARGQRIARVGEPVGKFQAALRLGRVGGQTEVGFEIENGDEGTGGDDLGGRMHIAADEAFRRRGLDASADVGGLPAGRFVGRERLE